MKYLRNVAGVIVGFILGAGVNMFMVTLGARVFPAPDGVNMADAVSIRASVHLLEPRHYVFPFLAHALGTLVGALVAYLLAGDKRAAFAYVVGLLFLAGGVAATTMIPAPGWFIALDLILAYLPMSWLATRLGTRITRRSAVA